MSIPNPGPAAPTIAGHQFKDYLLEKGYDVRVVLTESLEHACELATQGAVDYQCGLVTAAGGDGTLREVLHGLEGSNKLFLPIPCGTENLLANELGFDLHVDTLIKAFEGDCIRPLDLGTVNGRCFTSIAGFGFDGSVIHRISTFRTGHISHLTYFWPIWRTFWEYPFPPIKVIADGKEIFNGPRAGVCRQYFTLCHRFKHLQGRRLRRRPSGCLHLSLFTDNFRC